MRDNHLRVASGPRVDTSQLARLEQMLDEVILPRLERPGRYVGPFEARGVEPKPADPFPFLLLWPSVPEGVDVPVPLRPPYEAARGRWRATPEIVCVPAPDLERELVRHGLPLFSRPRWRRLTEQRPWLVWLREPSQLLGLLTLFRGCGLPARVEGRGRDAPAVLAAGPGARLAPEILRPFCDAVLLLDDPHRVVGLAGEVSGVARTETVALVQGRTAPGEAVFTRAAPQTSPDPGADSTDLVDTIRSQEEPPTRMVDDLRLPAVETWINANGTPVTLLRPWAASERLRRALELPGGTWLAEQARQAFETPLRELLVDLAVGLPGETPEDRESIRDFVRELAARATHGPRQIQVLVSCYAPGPDELADGARPVPPQAGGEWLERLSTSLRQGKVRCSVGDPARAWVDTLLAAAPADFAPVIEAVHRVGARVSESALARRADLWQKALQAGGFDPASDTSAGEFSPLGIALDPHGSDPDWGADPVIAAATALEHAAPQAAARPGTSPAAGRRGVPDRWQRWQALAPRQFDYRIEFAKRGRLRHVGHRELAALFLRACREAELPLATAGLVQPRPRIAFGPPLPVGVEGLREYVDVSLTEKASDLASSLNARLPEGLTVLSACFVPAVGSRTSLGLMARAAYESSVAPDHWIDRAVGLPRLASRIKSLRRGEEPVEPGESPDTELADQITEIQVQEQEGGRDRLAFVLDLTGARAKCRPRDVLCRLLGDLVHDPRLLPLLRTRQLARLEPESDRLVTPVEQVQMILRELRAKERRCA